MKYIYAIATAFIQVFWIRTFWVEGNLAALAIAFLLIFVAGFVLYNHTSTEKLGFGMITSSLFVAVVAITIVVFAQLTSLNNGEA